MHAQFSDGYRVIPIQKKSGKTEFRTVGEKIGVQWASCNKGIQQTKPPGWIEVNSILGGGVKSRDWGMGDEILVISGLIFVSPALFVFLPLILTLGVTAAGIVMTTATLKELGFITFTTEALNKLIGLLPKGTRVQFVEFKKPCSENAGVDF